MLMLVLHAAKLANGQALASSLEFLMADRIGFTRLKTLCRCLMGCCHGPVAFDVGLCFLVAMGLSCY
jgi:hypothetical protein